MDDIKTSFSGLPPRTDGLLDGAVDGAWHKRTFDECKAIAGDEEFFVLCVILYCDKTGIDVCQRLDWNLFHQRAYLKLCIFIT